MLFTGEVSTNDLARPVGITSMMVKRPRRIGLSTGLYCIFEY